VVLVTPYARGGWRPTDRFRPVAPGVSGETRYAQSFPNAHRSPGVILLSHWGLSARTQHPFLGILIAQERFLMAEAKTHTPSSERFPLFALGYSLLLAVLAAGGLYALFISGPAMRMAAQEQRERAIADEDRQSCAMFGMRSDSAAFAACSRELAIIRQKQVERDNAAAQGIL
jgi:hypothetical protein